MSSISVSEDLSKSNDELRAELEELRSLNTRLLTELQKRDALGSNQLDQLRANAHADPQKAEEALRESEARFRQVTDNIREVLWLQTHDFSSLLYISTAYETVCGRT